MSTANIRYYAKLVNTTQNGKKTPKFSNIYAVFLNFVINLLLTFAFLFSIMCACKEKGLYTAILLIICVLFTRRNIYGKES